MGGDRSKFICNICERLTVATNIIKIPETMLTSEQKKNHSIFGLDVCPACGVRIVVSYLMKELENKNDV